MLQACSTDRDRSNYLVDHSRRRCLKDQFADIVKGLVLIVEGVNILFSKQSFCFVLLQLESIVYTIGINSGTHRFRRVGSSRGLCREIWIDKTRQVGILDCCPDERDPAIPVFWLVKYDTRFAALRRRHRAEEQDRKNREPGGRDDRGSFWTCEIDKKRPMKVCVCM